MAQAIVAGFFLIGSRPSRSSHPLIFALLEHLLSNKISLSVTQHQNTLSYSALDIFLLKFPYITDNTG